MRVQYFTDIDWQCRSKNIPVLKCINQRWFSLQGLTSSSWVCKSCCKAQSNKKEGRIKSRVCFFCFTERCSTEHQIEPAPVRTVPPAIWLRCCRMLDPLSSSGQASSGGSLIYRPVNLPGTMTTSGTECGRRSKPWRLWNLGRQPEGDESCISLWVPDWGWSWTRGTRTEWGVCFYVR